MQSSKTWLLAIAVTTLSVGIHAADDGYSTTYTACMDESGGVTLNMLDCMGSETDQQDARLNQNYKAAMQALTPTQQTQLRDAQRLWIKFRDADCALLGSLTGGTIDSVNSASCFLDMTKKRADDLAWLAKQDQ
ncbi:lysozyme inhibitor LprI family protein [Pseudomonas sp. NPDC077186]|uniref:lysozyme inhibitor LprI family protein n=1 Tax=Pseudomonas sp. NPDC077186 TaxID=3364421 RepID=UPI0037C77C36